MITPSTAPALIRELDAWGWQTRIRHQRDPLKIVRMVG